MFGSYYLETNYKMKIRLNANIPNELKVIMADIIIDFSKKNNLKAECRNQTIIIEGIGDANDFAHIGIVMSELRKTDWFMNNVIYWIFYDSEGGAEDLILHYKSKNLAKDN